MKKLKQFFLKTCKAIWNGRNRVSIFILFLSGIFMNIFEFIGIYTNNPDNYIMALMFYPIIAMPIILCISVVFIVVFILETIFHLYLPPRLTNNNVWKFMYILGIFNLIPLSIYFCLLIFSVIYSFILWVLIH